MPSKKMKENLSAQEIIEEASKKPEFKKQILNVSISKEDIEKMKKSEEAEKLKKIPKEIPKEIKEVKTKAPKVPRKKIDFKKYFKKIDTEDKKAIKNFLIYATLYGLLINFSMFVIFKIPFTFYSWIGWGIAFWFIENKFVSIIRRIVRR